jgi:hypothetical protein
MISGRSVMRTTGPLPFLARLAWPFPAVSIGSSALYLAGWVDRTGT